MSIRLRWMGTWFGVCSYQLRGVYYSSGYLKVLSVDLGAPHPYAGSPHWSVKAGLKGYNLNQMSWRAW